MTARVLNREMSALAPLIRMFRAYLYFVIVTYYLQYPCQPIGIVMTRCYLIECLGGFNLEQR